MAPTGLMDRCSRTSEFSTLRTCTERTSSRSATSHDTFRHIKNNAAGPDAWEDIALSKLTDTPLPQMYAGVPGQGSRTSLVATLTLFGTLEKPTNASDRVCYRHPQMLRPNCQTTRLHDRESCWNSQENTHSICQYHGSNGYVAHLLLVMERHTHTRWRGIPQGCPFSMTLPALMVRPWIIQVQKKGAIPGVLADDLHLVAAGEKHHENCRKAIRDTHVHYHSWRTTRSKQELRDKRTRKRLYNTSYDILQYAKVPVVTHCRDLGGQLNMTERVMAPTLTKRIRKARRSIRKIGGIPTATERD